MDKEPGGTSRALPALALLAVTAVGILWGADRFSSPEAMRFVDRTAPAALGSSGSTVPHTPSPLPPVAGAPPTGPPTKASDPDRRDPRREPPRRTRSRPATSSPSPVERIEVPPIKGLAVLDARQALDRRGLSYKIDWVASSEPAGTVLTSEPAEGELLDPDSVVTLSASAGEPETPTPDPSAPPG